MAGMSFRWRLKDKIKLFVTIQLEKKEIQKSTQNIYSLFEGDTAAFQHACIKETAVGKVTLWETAELKDQGAHISLVRHAFMDIWDALPYDP